MYETEHALPSAAPASRWTWAYVAGPMGALVMALADAALVTFVSEIISNSSLTTAYEVISAVGIGVTALVAAYGSGRVRVGVAAAALASLIAAPLNALTEVGVAVLAAYAPSPADQSACGCGELGGPVFWLILAVIVFPSILCVFRLGLSVTAGLLSAWLGVLLSWALRGRAVRVVGRRDMAV